MSNSHSAFSWHNKTFRIQDQDQICLEETDIFGACFCIKCNGIPRKTVMVFSCDQTVLWMVQSINPSVCHTFLNVFLALCLMKLIIIDKSDVHAKGQGQMSKVKVRGQNPI